jgi:hypothetical protein
MIMATDKEDKEKLKAVESRLEKLVAYLVKGGIIPPM